MLWVDDHRLATDELPVSRFFYAFFLLLSRVYRFGDHKNYWHLWMIFVFARHVPSALSHLHAAQPLYVPLTSRAGGFPCIS